jgi:hypothetical protein
MRNKDDILLENAYNEVRNKSNHQESKKIWDIPDFPGSEEEHIEYNNVNYYIPYKRTGDGPDDFEILAIIPHEGQSESDEPLYNYHDGVQSLYDNPNEDIRRIYQIAGRKIYDKIEDDLIERGHYDKEDDSDIWSFNSRED